LFVDLSASLGGLTGAALATPLLFVGDDVHDDRSRAWYLSVLGGTVVGAAMGVWMTSPEPTPNSSAEPGGSPGYAVPYAGVIAESPAEFGQSVPAWGLGVRGQW
jgi:hypothetical protein